MGWSEDVSTLTEDEIMNLLMAAYTLKLNNSAIQVAYLLGQKRGYERGYDIGYDQCYADENINSN